MIDIEAGKMQNQVIYTRSKILSRICLKPFMEVILKRLKNFRCINWFFSSLCFNPGILFINRYYLNSILHFPELLLLASSITLITSFACSGVTFSFSVPQMAL